MFGFLRKIKLKVEVPIQVLIILSSWMGMVAGLKVCNHGFSDTRRGWKPSKGSQAANKLGSRLLRSMLFWRCWDRPDQSQVYQDLPGEFTDNYVPELHANNVKFRWLVRQFVCLIRLLKLWQKQRDWLRTNTGLILNFALNYGGRAEITQAVKLISQRCFEMRNQSGDITEELIGNYLFTQHLPRMCRDPDLIIRTSGELRLSNFLPWQGAYSELYFWDAQLKFWRRKLQRLLLLQSSSSPIWRSLGEKIWPRIYRESTICWAGSGYLPSPSCLLALLFADRDWLVSNARRPWAPAHEGTRDYDRQGHLDPPCSLACLTIPLENYLTFCRLMAM